LHVVFELEAEEAEHLGVEILRAREIADAEHQMIDAEDAGHLLSPPSWFPAAVHASPAGGRARPGAVGFRLRPSACRDKRGLARGRGTCCHPPRGFQPPCMPARREVERGAGGYGFASGPEPISSSVGLRGPSLLPRPGRWGATS